MTKLIDLVVDAFEMGNSRFLQEERRELAKREFLVIMTKNGWLECPVCELQMEPNVLEQHLKRGCHTEEEVLERIKERAERVLEGEEWDLASYCLELIDGCDKSS